MHPITNKKEWQAQYCATTQLLERIRLREIAAMTDEEALRIMKTLTVAEPPWRERPDWSGLIGQQDIFHRRKKP